MPRKDKSTGKMKAREINSLERVKKSKNGDAQLKKYWNKVLANEGLAVDRGRSTKVVYVGGIAELSVIELYKQESEGS